MSRWFVDASNDVHAGLMVYKSIVRTARSSKVQLLPERYTANLANELKRQYDSPVSRISTTLANSRDGKALHQYAYTLWRQGHGLLDICIRMGNRAKPQRETVVMCVSIYSSD